MTQKTPDPLKKIGIIIKKNHPERVAFLKIVTALLKKFKKEIYLDEYSSSALQEKRSYSIDEILKICDVALVMGGDGTLLKTAAHTLKKKTLIFGINLGNLGFLTETNPAAFTADLQKLFKGHYAVDKRSLLHVEHYRLGKKLHQFLALNDAVLNQGSFARLLTLEVEADHQEIVTLKADGLIVSSPTGSTAHSLSAGGPIVHPSLSALILTPICPATLSIRPIVIPDNQEVTINVIHQARENPAVGLTLDGQIMLQLQSGDQIKVRKSTRIFHLIRLQGDDQNYYAKLRNKLHWGKHHGE